jgi:hypothetical protein
MLINVVVNCQDYSVDGGRIKYNYRAPLPVYLTRENLEKNLPQCHHVCHESHTDWPGIRAWTDITYIQVSVQKLHNELTHGRNGFFCDHTHNGKMVWRQSSR